MENLTSIADPTNKYWVMAMKYLPTIAGALITFVIGLWVINIITRIASKGMMKRNLDISLQSFLSSLISVSLKVILLVSVAGMLGMQTTSFVAVLGAAGLAVGLALQGSLANFAGGVLILVFKPFKVGDIIESNGQTGEVKEIQIFNTILLTPENKTVILPNGAVSNGTIVNITRHGNLRVDITMAVSPENNISSVKQVVMDVLNTHPHVLRDPAPSVNVMKIADGAIHLTVRPFAKVENYWTVFFEIQEQLKTAFELNRVNAPVPHRIVMNKN